MRLDEIVDPGKFLAAISSAAFALVLQATADFEDAEAAMSEGDFATAAEALWICLSHLASAQSALEGNPLLPSETNAQLALAGSNTVALVELMPSPVAADVVSVSGALARLRLLERSIVELMPFAPPQVRSPEEFFSTLRMLREIEEVRASLELATPSWDLSV